MTTLTTPNDLVKPISETDLIIKRIEAAFKLHPKPHKYANSAYYIITVEGAYSPDDIKEVIAKYKEIGWSAIDVYRAYRKKSGEKIKLISTKFKFYEMY